MSAFFQPRSDTDYWFKLGRLQVTTTVLVVLIGLAGTVAGVVVRGLIDTTHFNSDLVIAGQLWRLVTWPLVDTLSIWTALTFVILWYFGNLLESTLGRDRMGSFFVGVFVIVTVSHLLAGIVIPGTTLLFGLGMAQLMVILLFIAEQPNRPFFFGIPAWVLGAVIVGLQILQLISFRSWASLIGLVLSLACVAVFARQMGLLSHATWIPGGSTKKRATKKRPPTRTRARDTAQTDEERIDTLLAKISAEGLHNLTKKERAELEKLRQRRHRS